MERPLFCVQREKAAAPDGVAAFFGFSLVDDQGPVSRLLSLVAVAVFVTGAVFVVASVVFLCAKTLHPIMHQLFFQL